jgi:hypothetical protein
VTLLLLVAGLTLGVVVLQEYVDRWFIRRSLRSRRETSRTTAASTVVLLLDDDGTFRERLAQPSRDRQVGVRTADSCEVDLVEAQIMLADGDVIPPAPRDGCRTPRLTPKTRHRAGSSS